MFNLTTQRSLMVCLLATGCPSAPTAAELDDLRTRLEELEKQVADVDPRVAELEYRTSSLDLYALKSELPFTSWELIDRYAIDDKMLTIEPGDLPVSAQMPYLPIPLTMSGCTHVLVTLESVNLSSQNWSVRLLPADTAPDASADNSAAVWMSVPVGGTFWADTWVPMNGASQIQANVFQSGYEVGDFTYVRLYQRGCIR